MLVLVGLGGDRFILGLVFLNCYWESLKKVIVYSGVGVRINGGVGLHA